MKYIIENEQYNFSLETKQLCETIDDIEGQDIDFLSSLIPDALCEYKVSPLGSFSEEEAGNIVYSAAENYLRSIEPSLYLTSKAIDENGAITKKVNIPILDVALSYLENDRYDCVSCARVGAYVEACLLDFVAKGVWQVGGYSQDGAFVNEEMLSHAEVNDGAQTWTLNGKTYSPCIWYGQPNEKPVKRWLISNQMPNSALKFWFEAETWSVISELGDFDDSFLIWYTAECGYCAPDMDEIRDSCPVSLTKEDTVETIVKKVYQYLRSTEAHISI